MKINLINENFTEDYAYNYLKTKGITNIEEYLNPPVTAVQHPSNLDNIEDGANLLLKVIHNNGNILLVVDSDNDGFTSSAIIYTYIKRINSNINIDYLLHEGKQHGLEDHIDYILENKDKYNLVILPDSSSNDY